MITHVNDRFRFATAARIGSVVLALVLAGCSGGGAGGSALPDTANSAGGANTALQTSINSAVAFGTYASVVAADSPVAYFRLDESNGTTAVDASKTALNGNYRGAMSFGNTSLIGGDGDPAAAFSGGNILIQNNTAAQPTAGLSLEAWIKPNSTTVASQLVKIISNSETWHAPYDAYVLGMQHGMPLMRVVIGGIPVQVIGSTAFSPGVTHHLVGTYDGSAVRLWVDGQLAASTPASGAISGYTPDGLAIGTDTAGQWAFRGTIDEVAVYAKALSLNRILLHEAAAQATSAYDTAILASSPNAYYRLSESVGANAYDAGLTGQSVNFGSNVAKSNTGFFGAGDINALFGGGLLNVARNNALFPSSALTVEAVVKPNADILHTSEEKVVSAGTPWTAPYDSYKLSIISGHPTMEIASGNSTYQVTADATISSNSTYHLVGTYDGTNLSIYANGILLKTKSASGPIFASNTTGMGIGGDVTANFLFHGAISDVAIYPTALSAGTIISHASLVPNLGTLGNLTAATPPPISIPISIGVPSSNPTASGVAPLVLTNSAVSILSLGTPGATTITEAGNSNGFYLLNQTCSSIANVSLTGSTLLVTPLSAGSCQAIVGDGNGQNITIPVTITLTSISGS